MTPLKTAREQGFVVGQMQPGPRNLITDVSGVRVGHVTISDKAIQTGVTAVLPHDGNLFREKVATDLPLCERQLGRLARRAQTGVARTGSTIDSGGLNGRTR